VDQAERYFQLTLLGKKTFLERAAHGALLRRAGESLKSPNRPRMTQENDVVDMDDEESTLVASLEGKLAGTESPTKGIEVYPLAKKEGAPFADMITVGRTSNNDVVLNDITVSRFHAFFRERDDKWFVCDAGSKNGTTLEGSRLEARKEKPLRSGDRVKLGDVEITFLSASDLFDVLSGTDTRNR
jgi:hypothetical protein